MQQIKLLSYFLTGLVLASCQINDPSLPDWDSRVKVHFRPDRVYMNEVLTENSLKDSLQAGFADTLIFLSIEDETEKQEIPNEDLAFDSDNEHKEEQIGIIKLDNPATQTTEDITLADLFPELEINPGETLPPFPAQEINPPPNKVRFDNFIIVDVENAGLSLVFHNDLPVDVGSGATVSVYDSVSGSLIEEIIFTEPINSGESRESSIAQLNNKTFANVFRLEYTIPLTGSDNAILLTEDAVLTGIRVDVNISDIKVNSATAKVPEQDFLRYGAYHLSTDDKEVKRAIIDKGKITLNIQNNLNVATTLDISILSATKNDVPKMVNVYLDAAGSKKVDFDLAGYTIQNFNDPGTVIDSIYYEVQAWTDSSEGFVTIASTDDLVFDMLMDSIYVSYMEGSLNDVEIEIDPVEESDLVDLNEIDGRFRLPSVILKFDFYNEIGFDVNVDLDITAFHKDSDTGVIDSLSIHVSDVLAAGSSQNAKQTTIVFDSTGSYPNIVDLMALLPTSIKVSGTGRVDGEGSAAKSDGVWAKYTIESPLQISLDEPLFFNTDLDSIPEDDIEEDMRKRISEDLSEVYLVLNSYNGLPLDTELKFIISTDSTDLINQTEMISKNIVFITNIDAGITDENGLVITPTTSTDELKLTGEQFKIFQSGPLFYKARIRVNESDGSVMFRKNDYFSYDGLLDIQLRVTNDD